MLQNIPPQYLLLVGFGLGFGTAMLLACLSLAARPCGGYQPKGPGLDTRNPPRGGSGVPR